MPESQCGKTQCWWQERQAVVFKRIFNMIKANLAKIQPKNHQHVQKRIFCKKFQESMGKDTMHCKLGCSLKYTAPSKKS